MGTPAWFTMIFTGLGRDRNDAAAPLVTLGGPDVPIPLVDDPIQNAFDAEWVDLSNDENTDTSTQPGGYKFGPEKEKESIKSQVSTENKPLAPSTLRQRTVPDADSE